MEKIDGCLRADSLIYMSDGTKKPIKDIKIGDLVKSFDESTNTFVDKIVNNVLIQDIVEYLDWFELELSNGEKIVLTENHPVLTLNGWIMAKDLLENDEIISIV